MRDIVSHGTTTPDADTTAAVAPGKTTRTQKLQRKADSAPAAEAAAGGQAGAPAGDHGDPFGMHLLGSAPTGPAEAAKLARTGTRVELPFRAELEDKLGRDLSRVEVFVGKPAADACAAMHAEAFTVGGMIAFATPTPSKATVMHELTHVLQQGGDQGHVEVPSDLEVTEQGGAEEREAETAESGTMAPAPTAGPAQAAAKPAFAAKPIKDNYCKTTATFELVDKKGGTSQGKLPGGTLVKVTAVQKAGCDIVVLGTGPWAGKTGYLPDGAIIEAQGVVGNQVFNQGRLGGELDGSGTMINCLGHASGEKRAAYITNGTTEDMLKGLGFTCVVGDSTVLTPQIKAGKYAMMVYMYMYKPAWRGDDDKALSFAELQKKYGWSAASWQQPNVYFGPKGEDLPIDYHALNFNSKTKSWEWVANNRLRDHAPTYDVDSKGTEPAAANPDAYFGGGGQVLVSIACYK